MEESKSEPVLIGVADIPPREFLGVGERSYRRGVTHGLETARRCLLDGGDLSDLERMIDEAMEMRCDNQQHPAFTLELARRVPIRCRKSKSGPR